MAENGHEHSGSHLFVGLAGETAPGKPISSGLYRVHHGAGDWNLAVSGLPQAPEVRAITFPTPPDTGRFMRGRRMAPMSARTVGTHGQGCRVSRAACPCGRSCSIHGTL